MQPWDHCSGSAAGASIDCSCCCLRGEALGTDYRLQITKWPHKGGARNGAKLGSMGIIHHARLINIIIIVRRKRINLITNQT